MKSIRIRIAEIICPIKVSVIEQSTAIEPPAIMGLGVPTSGAPRPTARVRWPVLGIEHTTPCAAVQDMHLGLTKRAEKAEAQLAKAIGLLKELLPYVDISPLEAWEPQQVRIDKARLFLEGCESEMHLPDDAQT